jgi:hypothetical protein
MLVSFACLCALASLREINSLARYNLTQSRKEKPLLTQAKRFAAKVPSHLQVEMRCEQGNMERSQ